MSWKKYVSFMKAGTEYERMEFEIINSGMNVKGIILIEKLQVPKVSMTLSGGYVARANFHPDSFAVEAKSQNFVIG